VSPRGHARLLALTFAAEAAFAIVHRATGTAYPGFSHVHDVVVDTGLAVIWTSSAVAALVHRGWPAFFMILVGATVSIIHGVNFSIALTQRGPFGVGVPVLVAAAVQFYLAVHAAPAFFEARAPRAEQPAAAPWRPAWLARIRHSH
jgi:hypothetical protein